MDGQPPDRDGRLSSEWVEHVQDHWDANGCKFTVEQRHRIVCAALSCSGAPLICSPTARSGLRYQHQTTEQLLVGFEAGDDEAGWELVARLSAEQGNVKPGR